MSTVQQCPADVDIILRDDATILKSGAAAYPINVCRARVRRENINALVKSSIETAFSRIIRIFHGTHFRRDQNRAAGAVARPSPRSRFTLKQLKCNGVSSSLPPPRIWTRMLFRLSARTPRLSANASYQVLNIRDSMMALVKSL